jgi:subtilisin-like proprotein convertase family protein
MIAIFERIRLGAAALAVVILTAACGGGGGGNSGPPPPTFTVGGTVNGLTAAGLSLVLNGSETVDINTSGGVFNFTTLVPAGSTFSVVVATQPSGESCSVDNGGGLMPAANVTVNVICTDLALSTFSLADAAANNPLVSQQWHLLNTAQNAFADLGGTMGMDIDVDPVFRSGYTGAGVTVAVVDTGLEIAHEDLAANVVLRGSWNFNTKSIDPTNTVDADGDHGTSVAGLIAMENNSVGGIGVAPRARLKGFNLLAVAKPLETQFLDSIGASSSAPNSGDVAIFNQSFGISTLSSIPFIPGDIEEAQYRSGVTTLRGGRGALYVKAAGNGFASYTDAANQTANCGIPGFDGQTFTGLSCENASMDPSNTLPYQIVVGATNSLGVRATYSTPGSALWVSAPGGEFGRNQALDMGFISPIYSPAMVTTDQSGCAKGFSTSTTNNGSTFDNGDAPNSLCNYTNGMNGTSSATPVTAGVIALMLEANPSLTWRDVKHILAFTAGQIDAARAAVTVLLPNPAPNSPFVAEPAWTLNKAAPTPFHFHNWYGFGMVDASRAVNMAKTYAAGSFGVLADTGFIPSAGTLGLSIPDDSAIGVSHALTVSTSIQFIEAVQIKVNITHTDAGDLGIELLSPQGTRSVLKTVRDGFEGSANLTDMVLLSNAFYGESPTGGPWTIKVVDGEALHTGTLNNWAIRIYGH